MNKLSGKQDLPLSFGGGRVLSVILWLAVGTGWAVSIFTVIDEMCLATACSDAASFTIFGINIGWSGITYFSLMLILLWLRKKLFWLNWVLYAMVFTGIGTEFHLLWIQKFIIGGWCPLCVMICSALFVTAITLLIEKAQMTGSVQGSEKNLSLWIAFVVTMIAAGLAIAIVGIQALT